MFDASAFNDIASGVATSVLAIVAALGLGAWRKQLAGTADHELARRVLRSVLRVRDEISRVRSPLVSGGETAAAVHASGEPLPEDPHEASLRTYELAYESRWARLVQAQSDLEAELIEAEVLWDSLTLEASREMRAAVNRLHTAIRSHLKSRRRAPRTEAELQRNMKNELILWAGGDGEEGDLFEAEVLTIVADFETILRPKLSR